MTLIQRFCRLPFKGRYTLIVCSALVFLLVVFVSFFPGVRPFAIDAIKTLKVPAGQPELHIPSNTTNVKIGLVIPKTRHDDVRWIVDNEIRKRFTAFVYTTDRFPEPQYLKPRTRAGREASAYLSYILDYYDALPEYSMFIHAGQDQWHNDVFSKNTNQPDTLRNFRTEAVDAHGYVNLRCKQHPGCPTPMKIFDIPENDVPQDAIRKHFVEMYMQLFGVKESEVPAKIGNVCCAQFAVSRSRIQQRSREEYGRMLDWAQETRLVDDFGVGWMFEKVWHIVFGMEPVLCPNFEQCRCDNFGWCGPLVSGKTLVPAKAKQKGLPVS